VRRGDREIRDREQIDSIIRRCRVCRLGLSDEGQPYVVPLCFGYDGAALYFHCSPKGRKLDILRRNNKVCVEFDLVEGMVEADQGCDWGIRYQSAIGFGTAEVVEGIAEKQAALGLLMAQYSERSYVFPPEMLARTAVVKVAIDSLTGKQTQR
jgi:hypothetical protein